MCGICGIYNVGNSQEVSRELLGKMTDILLHRGPDDRGWYRSRNKTVGLGNRRLAIVDLSPAGHQPMSNADGSVWITYNGEIYNHLQIRRSLEEKGYSYRSRTDTETILHAYEEYGINCVHKLLGMFAFAIWDEEQQSLFLARDRIGIKPLYYTFVKGSFIFSSEIKAILEHPAVERDVNEEGLYHYLTFLITPAPMTMFKGINKLEAGHYLIVDKNGNVTNEQYWDCVELTGEQPTIDANGVPVSRQSAADTQQLTEDSCIQTLRALLKESIKDRMMSDVPFGVFLSGGMDSSTNVALMAELMDRPVDTFSVGFRDLEKYNELGYARQIAKLFKTNHHEIIIDYKDALDFIPKLIYHQDEPLADPVCIPLYFVSKLARDNGTIVIQVGEGSDEQFAGYNWMLRELRFYNSVWKYYTALPQFAKKGFYKVAAPLFEKQHWYLPLEYVRKASFGDELFWGGAINFTETHKQHLLNGWFRDKGLNSHLIAKKYHDMLLVKDPDVDYLKRMIYLEFKNRLPELLLMRVDKVSMATSVEARVPFLDHRIVEFSMRIPLQLKIKNGTTKYVLKKAVEGIIPNEIIYRKKQGFATPVNEWLRNQLANYAYDKLFNSEIRKRGYFNYDFIKRLYDNHKEGKRNEGQNLWNLMNLNLWYDYWIEGKSI